MTVDAARDLVLGQAAGWSVVGSLAWSLGLIAVFGPLAVRRYRQGFLMTHKLPEGRSR